MPKKQSSERFRNFGFLIYRESRPDNWLEILEKFRVPTLVSPEHCQDTDEDGVLKKPHNHVMVCFSGNKNPHVLDNLIDALHGPPHVEIIQDVAGNVRYLSHADNKDPHKTEYPVEEFIALNGFDLEKYFRENTSEIIESILEVIDRNNLRTFRQLVFRVRDQPRLLPYVVKYAYFFYTFLKD